MKFGYRKPPGTIGVLEKFMLLDNAEKKYTDVRKILFTTENINGTDYIITMLEAYAPGIAHEKALLKIQYESLYIYRARTEFDLSPRSRYHPNCRSFIDIDPGGNVTKEEL